MEQARSSRPVGDAHPAVNSKGSDNVQMSIVGIAPGDIRVMLRIGHTWEQHRLKPRQTRQFARQTPGSGSFPPKWSFRGIRDLL
jgi:hypothetical protein